MKPEDTNAQSRRRKQWVGIAAAYMLAACVALLLYQRFAYRMAHPYTRPVDLQSLLHEVRPGRYEARLPEAEDCWPSNDALGFQFERRLRDVEECSEGCSVVLEDGSRVWIHAGFVTRRGHDVSLTDGRSVYRGIAYLKNVTWRGDAWVPDDRVVAAYVETRPPVRPAVVRWVCAHSK